MKGNSINCFFKLIIYLGGGYFDYSPWALKILATPVLRATSHVSCDVCFYWREGMAEPGTLMNWQ
jgi:hypothetical protein